MIHQAIGDLSITVDYSGNVIVLDMGKTDDKGNSPTVLETTIKNLVLGALGARYGI